MNRRTISVALAVAALCGTAAGARDDDDDEDRVRVSLAGFNEVAAVSSRGRGEFRAKIKDDLIEFTLSYSRLNSAAFMAHIHLGQKDVNGGISAWLCGTPPAGVPARPACPAGNTDETVSVSGTVGPADVIGPTGQGIAAGEFAELLRAIDKGVTYVNVHTATQGGGEIRGQIGDDERGRGGHHH